jgi:beta-1,4-N-acetylglucosaminyltransferase
MFRLKKYKVKPILLVAGEGGHLEQARRFNKLNSEYAQEFIVITDEQQNNIKFNCTVVRMKNISRLLKQRSFLNLMQFFFLFSIQFIRVLRVIVRTKPHGVVAFGPIFCVPFIFWARILRLNTVYVETWSKFYNPSITAKVCIKIAHRLYIQNITLKNKLRNSIYAGKL